MEFTSLNEILSHFDIEESDIEIVKKRLKKQLKLIHPDRNNDKFKNDEDKDKFNQIKNALDFFKKSNTALEVRKENTALVKAIKDLSIQKKRERLNEELLQKKSELSSQINNSISLYHDRNSTPKVTGIIITMAISAMWAFPNIAKKHPLLSILYEFNIGFLLLWIACLVFMGIMWLKIKNAETQDAQLKQGYKTEIIQNHMFMLFVKWFQYDYKNFKYIENHKTILTFSTDDLIMFLMNRYDLLKAMIAEKNLVDDYYSIETIREWEKSKNFNLKKKALLMKYSVSNLIPKPGNIDIETANNIGNIIIQRLLFNKVIEKSSLNGLSDIYTYKIP